SNAHRLPRHPEMEIARREALAGLLDFRFDLLVPKSKAPPRRAVEEAYLLRRQLAYFDTGVATSLQERRQIKLLLAMTARVVACFDAFEILGAIEALYPANGAIQLVGGVGLDCQLRLSVAELLPKL